MYDLEPKKALELAKKFLMKCFRNIKIFCANTPGQDTAPVITPSIE